MVERRNLKLVKSGDKQPPGAAAYKRARETKRAKRSVERRRLKVPQHLLLALQAAIGQRERPAYKNPFILPAFPPAAADAPKAAGMALDDNAALGDNMLWAGAAWQSQVAMYQEGLVFPGYVYLAELTQRPEYRVVAETISTEMTRKWIKIKSTASDDDDDAEQNKRIKALGKELERLRVQHWFQKAAEIDCFFGRSHLYIDIGDPAEKDPNKTAFDKEELLTPIGTGKDDISKSKIGKGWLKRLKVIEPIWVYPTNYNASNPLSTDWYEPDVWYVMGTRIHKSRLLRFVGREVPDILKPSYAFGGIAMSQLLKPYVDNWLRTRQSVADIVSAFSTFVLSTDLSSLLTESGDDLLRRLELFITTRNNKGVMAIDKDTEAFQNVSAPLGSLDSIQAQTQEHMAAIARIPLVKLLGIQPAGLNASSEGEIRAFYDFVHAYQEHLFRSRLDPIFHMAQLSLWGEVDEELTYEFEPLWELDEAALAGVQKTKSDMHNANVQGGLISPEEARRAIANDPDSPYQGLDINDIPEPPAQPGTEGGDLLGGEGGPEQGGPGGGTPNAGERHEGEDDELNDAGIPQHAPDDHGPSSQRGSFIDERTARGLGRNARVVGVSLVGGKRVALVELGDAPDEERAAGEGVEPLDEDFEPDSDSLNDVPPYDIGRENDDEPGSRPELGYPKAYPKKGDGDKRRFYERQRLNSSDDDDAEAQGRDDRRGGFTGDAALLFTPEARAARFIMALDKRLTTQWNEQEHPRGPDGKFVEYSIGAGLAKQAVKLGFTTAQHSPSGKIRLAHKSGAVLIVEPAGKGVASQKYTLYRPGQEPIHDVTGQSGRSFAQKIAPFLDTEKLPPDDRPPPPPKTEYNTPPAGLKDQSKPPRQPKPKKQPETREQKIERALKEMTIDPRAAASDKGKAIAQKAAQVAADLGLRDFKKIIVSDGFYEFELNGRKMRAGGTHGTLTGEIKIYIDDMDTAFTETLMAHEIMHDKWAYVKGRRSIEIVEGWKGGAVDRELDYIGGMLGYKLREGVSPSKYPFLTKMNKAFFSVPEHVWIETDGITNYSQEYWKSFKDGKSSFDTAVNETLAEISGLQYGGEHYWREGEENKGKRPRNDPKLPNRHEPIYQHHPEPFKNRDPRRIKQSHAAWLKLFNLVDELYGKESKHFENLNKQHGPKS
jgi:uncharacterized protein